MINRSPLGKSIRPANINLLRVGVLAFALVAISLALYGINPYHQLLQITCVTDCLVGQLTPAGAQVEHVRGSTLKGYADLQILIVLFASCVLLVLAGALLGRRSSSSLHLLAAAVLIAVATGLLVQAAAYSTPVLRLPAGLIQWSGIIGLITLFCLMPDGQFRPRWLGWMILLVAPLTALVVFGSFPFWSGLVLGMIGLVMGSLIYRYRISSSQQQEQIIWALCAAVLLIAAQIVGNPLRLLPVGSIAAVPPDFQASLPVFGLLLVVGAVTCLAVALLSDELFRLEVVLNRAFVYGALTLFVVTGYVLVVGYLSLVFQSRGNLGFSLVATGLVAVFFQPVQRRMQGFVNQLLYGDRDEPYVVLSRLGQRLQSALQPAQTLPLTLEIIAQALKVPYVAIHAENGSKDVEWGQLPAQFEPSSFPLLYAGERLGTLVVAPRAIADPLSWADRRLLGDLAGQIAISMHALRLRGELEQARLRLVNAREEARRRLGSDLHDSVGHQLAGLNRHLERATGLLDSDPTTAKAMLGQIGSQINDTILLVRRLAHQLHPPELELLGLVGALSERAQLHRTLLVGLDLPEALPPIPTTTETAAYYIALEALANVEKHAGAQRCTLSLRFNSETSLLELEVFDDGMGISAEAVHSLGLLSMQARAAEVGGSCTLETTPRGGTRVSVRLPCVGG